MIFLSKNEPTRRSGRDACSSAVALFIAIGIIAGLAGLIFGKRKKQHFFFFIILHLGLVTNHLAATIAGGVVLGVSVFLTLLFLLILGTCLKK
jgi:LPXTG-motif cell wall-anchored protein